MSFSEQKCLIHLCLTSISIMFIKLQTPLCFIRTLFLEFPSLCCFSCFSCYFHFGFVVLFERVYTNFVIFAISVDFHIFYIGLCNSYVIDNVITYHAIKMFNTYQQLFLFSRLPKLLIANRRCHYLYNYLFLITG